ncbi:MAG: dethiobiotin synthase [Pirellulales bacterium]
MTGVFVVGTDTGVGKTHVAAAIARTLVAAGHRVGAYKPVASGFATADIAGSDARRLWEAIGRRLSCAAVCPQSFAAPIAPHRSARAEARRVDERLLRDGLSAWVGHADVIVVEGAGGLFSPLGDTTLGVDLARDFALPLVVVDAVRLGMVGRTLTTVRAARAEGLRVAAVVLSQVLAPAAGDGPQSDRGLARDALADLTARLPDVPLMMLEHEATVMPAGIDWHSLTRA